MEKERTSVSGAGGRADYTGVETESSLALERFLLLAKSDMVMFPMAGISKLWFRRASNVAEMAPWKENRRIKKKRDQDLTEGSMYSHQFASSYFIFESEFRRATAVGFANIILRFVNSEH